MVSLLNIHCGVYVGSAEPKEVHLQVCVFGSCLFQGSLQFVRRVAAANGKVKPLEVQSFVQILLRWITLRTCILSYHQRGSRLDTRPTPLLSKARVSLCPLSHVFFSFRLRT